MIYVRHVCHFLVGYSVACCVGEPCATIIGGKLDQFGACLAGMIIVASLMFLQLYLGEQHADV